MLSLSFSLRRTEDKPTSRPPEVQTGFGREMPSLAPYAFVLATPRAHRQSPRPLILFLTRRGRVDQASLAHKPGPARLILQVLYLSEKSMSTDMLTRVQTLQARELARKEARRELGRRLGSRVTGMQCRISPCSRERVKGDRAERNAHLVMQCRRAYTYMRIHARHARPAVS